MRPLASRYARRTGRGTGSVFVRVFDRWNCLDLDTDVVAILPLDTNDVHIFDNISRCRIDTDRISWTLKLHAARKCERFVGIQVSAQPLGDRINRVHHIETGDICEARHLRFATVRFSKGTDEQLIDRCLVNIDIAQRMSYRCF